MDRALAGPGATVALAARLAAAARPGDLILLAGELGAGKTHFARAFLAARAGAPLEVPSPSFTLVQIYDLPGASVAHVDLYRIRDSAELAELGLDDAFESMIVLVEWPDRLGPALPADRLEIAFDFAAAPEERCVRLEGHGAWAARLAEALA